MSGVLWRCAAVALVWVAFVFGGSGLQHTRAQHVLYQQLRVQLEEETVPVGAAIAVGVPIAMLDIPAIELRQVIVEGTAPQDLRDGPGHRRDTPLPGQAGTSIVYGRSVAFGAPFSAIARLRRGDVIGVTTGQGMFEYTVEGVRHVGDPLPDALESGAGRLTLVSSEASGWRRGWAPDRPVYVDAALKGQPQPTPAGRPGAIPAVEMTMASDGSAWMPLVLWLQVLLAGVAALMWLRTRWGATQTRLVGIPVLLAAAWGVGEAAMQLLPNLY